MHLSEIIPFFYNIFFCFEGGESFLPPLRAPLNTEVKYDFKNYYNMKPHNMHISIESQAKRSNWIILLENR